MKIVFLKELHMLVLMLAWAAVCLNATEAPSIYGIHDHEPFPGEFLTKIENGNTRGWVTATVAVGANPNDQSGASFTTVSSRGHTVICRINYGYYPDGTIPVPAKWDDFAARCAKFVANSTGCNIWLIANETNLASEWPFDGARFNYISPQDYATLYRKVYNAIRAVRPNDKILPQALAPWAGPYGSGLQNVGGQNYPHDGMPINWVQYLNQMLTAIAASGPLDGISLHIGSRGYAYADIHSTQKINAGGQNLYWSFYSYKDWVDLGIPASLYHLPLYATECNGMFYFKGGHPEDPSKHYESGWMQEMYAEIDRYNQQATSSGKPVFRCVNLYRWCAFCDGWNIDGASNPYKVQIMSDLDASVAQGYRWPTNSAPTNAPPAPSNLTASVGPGRVTLNWSPALSASSYNIKRSTTNGGPYSLIASNINGTSFMNTSFTPGTTYFYRVSGVNVIGEGPDSNQASATPTQGLPDVVVTAISWSPSHPYPGSNVVFSATVKNQGSAPTPAGTIIGVGFSVDGSSVVSWSGNYSSSLAAGNSVTLAADSGPGGTNYWIATPGAHTVTATVDDVNRFAEGDESNNSLTVPFNVMTTGYALNSGGNASAPFAADNFFSGSTNTFSVTNAIDTSAASNAAPQAVYQSERWGNFTYNLGSLLPNNAYSVRLHFAEISPSVSAAGQRQFHVSINGSQVLTNFDTFAVAGGKFRAVTRDFSTMASGSGQITVQFAKGASNEAKCSGVEVLPGADTPPALNAIPNLTINEEVALRFQIFAFDPQAGQVIADFETYASGQNSVLFNRPRFSSTTTAYLDASPDSTLVSSLFPSGNSSSRVLHSAWSFKSATTNHWLRLTTSTVTSLPNPTVDFTQALRFKVYSDQDIRLGIGLRETSTTAAIGGNGGASGAIEFIGVTNSLSGTPQPARTIPKGRWTTVQFNFPQEPVTAFTGNSVLESSTGKGVLEHLAILPSDNFGTHNLYLDDFAVIPATTFTYNLANAPAGMTIDSTSGEITWSPTEMQGPAAYPVSVRVVKNGNPSLAATNTFTVTVSEINRPPVLASVANRTVNAGNTLIFTNSATDPDWPINTLTFSLDPDAPASATVDPANGVLTWTTPPSVEHYTNVLTIRVTDNGTPTMSDFQSVSIVVVAPPRASSVNATPEQAIMNWSAFPGKTYRVQFKNHLNEAAWTTMGSDLVATSSILSITNITSGINQRYYRLVQLD